MAALFSDDMLMRSLLIMLLLGSIAGLLTGLALLLQPQWLQRASKQSNRWISTRQLSRPLMHIFNLDSWFYRHNRLSGAVIFGGSVYIIYYFTAVFDGHSVFKNIFQTALIHPYLKAGLIDALVLGAITGAVFALLVSVFIILRPSMLRDFELRANRKTSLRQAIRPLEIQRNGLDQLIFKHMRLAGVLISAGSLYTLLVLFNYWKFV